MKPGKIVCVGRNYAAHAAELGNEIPKFPLVFLKPASSVIGDGENIVYPDFSEEMHHEVELVLRIGKTIKNGSLEEAEAVIDAYTVGLDMTLRDIQSKLKEKGHPWTIAKCFDTSAVIGEFVSAQQYKPNFDEKISLKINGEIRQEAPLSLMLFKPAEIVKYISEKMTLEEGDYIMTGTPAGVGKVEKGDILEAEVENIAKLKVTVV
ncbi:MAG: acylpyruvase [Melioribacteraceae bacterium]|nr:MAG: acylpyruvase [Melioribacteraceae bacterium]